MAFLFQAPQRHQVWKSNFLESSEDFEDLQLVDKPSRAEKFAQDPRRFHGNKMWSGGIAGTLFSKPRMVSDWLGEWGVAAECYANRVVDRLTQE